MDEMDEMDTKPHASSILSMLSTPSTSPCSEVKMLNLSARALLTGLLFLAAPLVALGDERGRIYEDVFLRTTEERLLFGNARLQVELDARTGDWVGLRSPSIPGSLIETVAAVPTIDFQLGDAWMVEQRGSRLLRHEVEIDRRREDVALRLVFEIPSLRHDGPGYELTAVYTLHPGQGRLDRSARLLRLEVESEKAEADRLQGFVFRLPGVAVGDPRSCLVDVPGPWWPKTFIAPETPYEKLLERNIEFHSAPDLGFGLLALTNKRMNAVLGTWMDTGGEVNYRPSISSLGKRLTFCHRNLRYYRLSPGIAVSSDTQRIEVLWGSLRDLLFSYRETIQRSMPMDDSSPPWVKEMVLLEVYPQYYRTGFKEIAHKLPSYKEIGFNTIYLMPHWRGGYSPIDLFQVDPALGSSEELRALVKTAHGLGMRVLFDMVVHGFNDQSDIPKRRPELFVHDEQGNIARHPDWKSLSADWASPAYQQYMVDLVRHDLREYGIDGYRVDAAYFKGPNWDPRIPYPAYLSGTASTQVMSRMLEAMREIKPEAVLLSEVFGPAFYSVFNLAHDNQTEAPARFLEMWEAGDVTAEDYRLHMANVIDLLPAGANRVFFARNHDTSWFYRFGGYTPAFLALDAIHALFGIPEVFAGDPKNRPSPDESPAVYLFYRKLFGLRKMFPELAGGEVLLRMTSCDNRHVFTGLRRRDGLTTLAAVSMSPRAEEVNLQVQGIDVRADLVFLDFQSNKEIKPLRLDSKAGKIRLRLEPFQVLVGRLQNQSGPGRSCGGGAGDGIERY
jgi:glycosidase